MRARTSCFFVAILGLNFSSPFAAAQEARAPDLTDLRDAVRDASKRGGNMLDVTKALDELAKWLEKGFAELKPGEKAPSPPGLLALRQAVETAGRKGEKVDA
ncbi:MAG TPA: hypothetical protein VLM40_09985, partial [Gemmata sp.]|nr:hypothetical protein [Gemmata sp.]